MEGPSWVAGEPGVHLRVLVAAVVVEHHVDRLSHGDCRLDGVEETDELTVAMTLHAAAEHGAFQDVEGGKQRRGAVAGVVVCLSGRMPGPEWLIGTGSLQGLDLALLVDGQHDGVGGRLHIETDDILDFFGEGRIV